MYFIHSNTCTAMRHDCFPYNYQDNNFISVCSYRELHENNTYTNLKYLHIYMKNITQCRCVRVCARFVTWSVLVLVFPVVTITHSIRNLLTLKGNWQVQ